MEPCISSVQTDYRHAFRNSEVGCVCKLHACASRDCAEWRHHHFWLRCQSISPVDGSIRWANYIGADGTYGTPAIDVAGNVYHGSSYKIFKITNTGATAMMGYLEAPGSSYLGNTWSSAITDSTGKIYLRTWSRQALDASSLKRIHGPQLEYGPNVPCPIS